MSNLDVEDILSRSRIITVVGISRDQQKDSYKVASYLKSSGYQIVPINPYADHILGEKCYVSLLKLPTNLKSRIDIVDIFRPSNDVPEIVNNIISLKKRYDKPYVIWMQIGIVNEFVARKSREAGIYVVMDKCLMIEHKKLFRNSF